MPVKHQSNNWISFFLYLHSICNKNKGEISIVFICIHYATESASAFAIFSCKRSESI